MFANLGTGAGRSNALQCLPAAMSLLLRRVVSVTLNTPCHASIIPLSTLPVCVLASIIPLSTLPVCLSCPRCRGLFGGWLG